MDTNFGSMPEFVKASLADSLSGIAAIRESLRASTQFSAVRKEIESQNRINGILTKDILSPADLIKKLDFETTPEVMRQMQKIKELQRPIGSLHKTDLNIPHLLPTAETPIGRAAIAGEESARQLKEVASMAAEITDKIATLSEVMLTKVLPQWFKNLQDGADTTNDSLQQAKTSVNLAKKAIFWSIGATVAMTMWQIWLAREYKFENDDQQNKSLELMSKQLKESKDLSKQLAEDSKKLNEQLTKMNRALNTVPFTKSPPPIHSPALDSAIGSAARAEEP